MTHIVQIVPSIGPGSGVAGVAWNLEREWRAMGHTVESFTMDTAHRGPARRWPRHRVLRALWLFRRMVWFTAVGTARAKEFIAERPEAVAICHNGVMTGDVYVNHGVVGAAMAARGHALWRMMRNPTHVFTFVRDSIRYRAGIHPVVVALARSEVETLHRVYGKVLSRIVVIPNGVDLDAFRPPSPPERRAARDAFHLDDDARVVLFVGHEFGRKGLDYLIRALAHAPSVLLMAVGGDPRSIEDARRTASECGVTERVLFTGPRRDRAVLFAAADMFALPSAYEATPLVVLEALASGLPVVCTPVGYAPEVIVDGENGFLVTRDVHEIAARLEEVAALEPRAWGARARSSVEQLGWRGVAEQYVALVEEIRAERVRRDVSA